MSIEKGKVIYVLSNGRSGTTILDSLLNSIKGVCSLGEVNVLPWEARENHDPCACGKQILECPYWSSIYTKLEFLRNDPSMICLFRESYGAGKVVRWKQLLNIVFGKKPRRERLSRFCYQNCRLFDAAHEELKKHLSENISYLVDSSKDSYRFWWLFSCKNRELRVIHVVKDPRAFVYSMVKHNRGLSLWRKSIRMAGRYVIENLIIDLVSRKISKNNFFRLKYEDVASDPEGKMLEISRWLGINEPYVLPQNSDKPYHGISNYPPSHWPKEIVLDERWKEDLSPIIRFLTKILTYFPAKRYGYFK